MSIQPFAGGDAGHGAGGGDAFGGGGGVGAALCPEAQAEGVVAGFVAGRRQRQVAQAGEARERFGEWVDQALAGELSDWAESPEGWLALVLLLDQLPRMIYRGTPRAFAGDERAQQLVRDGMAHGGDVLLTPLQRVFIYLVLEHAEHLGLQDQAVHDEGFK